MRDEIQKRILEIERDILYEQNELRFALDEYSKGNANGGLLQLRSERHFLEGLLKMHPETNQPTQTNDGLAGKNTGIPASKGEC